MSRLLLRKPPPPARVYEWSGPRPARRLTVFERGFLLVVALLLIGGLVYVAASERLRGVADPVPWWAVAGGGGLIVVVGGLTVMLAERMRRRMAAWIDRRTAVWMDERSVVFRSGAVRKLNSGTSGVEEGE